MGDDLYILIYENAKVNSYIENFTYVASSYANVLTKASVYISKEFNFLCTDWFTLGHQHGRRLIVLGNNMVDLKSYEKVYISEL